MRERPHTTVAALAGVTKRYGPVTALENVDLALHAGEVLARLGPNGAGKSTALGLLIGRLLPDAGRVQLYGQDPTLTAARRRIGVMLQEAKLPETLKVRELVALFASYYPAPRAVAETFACVADGGSGAGRLGNPAPESGRRPDELDGSRTMNTTSTMYLPNAEPLPMSPRQILRLYAMEAWAECLRMARTPAFMLPTLAFPVVFYLMFAVMLPGQWSSFQKATYLFATYGVFAVIGPALFGFGVGLAMDRDCGTCTWAPRTVRPASCWPAYNNCAVSGSTWLATSSICGIRRRRLCWSATETAIIPGNHDEPLRGLVGQTIGAATVRRRAIHTTADGRRLLVTHGDEFDAQTHRGNLRERFGEWCYDSLCSIDAILRGVRSWLGLRRWSLARYVKTNSPAAQEYVARYRTAVLADARRRGLDGAICGHIHQPELIDGPDGLYANDGDFVEHCSSLVETLTGQLKLVEWHGGEALVQPSLDPAGLSWVPAGLAQRQQP